MRIMIATSAVLGLCACTTTPAELREREVVGTIETTKPANDVAACLAEAFSKVGPPVILDKNGSKIVEFHSSNIYRSEEHTSELQSLMRTSYAVFCLKKK